MGRGRGWERERGGDSGGTTQVGRTGKKEEVAGVVEGACEALTEGGEEMPIPPLLLHATHLSEMQTGRGEKSRHSRLCLQARGTRRGKKEEADNAALQGGHTPDKHER